MNATETYMLTQFTINGGRIIVDMNREEAKAICEAGRVTSSPIVEKLAVMIEDLLKPDHPFFIRGWDYNERYSYTISKTVCSEH
jgi:hypothetical protein